MSQEAPSVGGGATIDRSRSRDDAGPDPESPMSQLTRSVVQAAQDVDPAGLQALLDLAEKLVGIDRCIDEIALPATRRLRRMRQRVQLDGARELMATEAIRTWLDRRGSFAPAPADIGPILLACGPRDLDMVGPESLALLLRFRRRPCRVLGARTSTFNLTIAAQAADTTAVVVFSGERRGRRQAAVSIRAVDALHLPVFFAGNAFHTRRSRLRLPGRYLGGNIATSCELLVNSIAPV